MTETTTCNLALVHTNLEHIRSLVSVIRELQTPILASKDVGLIRFSIEQKISPLLDIIEDLTRNARKEIERLDEI